MADEGRTSGPTKGGQGGKSGLKVGAKAGHISREVGAGKTSGTSGLAAVTGRGKKPR